MLVILGLQVVLPSLLLGWLWWRPLPSRLGLTVQVTALGVLIAALIIVGLWLALPFWLPYIYAVLLAVGAALALRRPVHGLPMHWGEWLAMALFVASIGLVGAMLTEGIEGRTPPSGDVVDLAPPLRAGGLLVVNGGGTETINAHLMTLDPAVPRFRRYRGQSYAVDIVRLNGAGRTTSGLRPSDPAAYAIWGEPVFAPCSGRVVWARNDRPDMPVPLMDRTYLLGNHVILACGQAHVVLAHFRRGSLRVRPGEFVEVGDLLGTVGNSGNSQEPHLHIHAQRPSSAAEPIAGAPLPIRIGGRALVRNDRF